MRLPSIAKNVRRWAGQMLIRRSLFREKGVIEYVWAPTYTSRYGKARAERFVARHSNSKRRSKLERAGRKAAR